MTTFTLNQKPISKQFNNSQKLDEVVEHIFETAVGKESVLVNLKVDGNLIPFEDGLEVCQMPIESFSEIDFEVQSSVELAFEALDSCNDYIQILTEKTMSLTRLYQENKAEEANDEFSEMIDILDLYVQLFAKIHSTLKRNFKGAFTHTEEIQKLDIHLLSVLKALIPAKEKGDIIMLCDLLEYELVDNLTQWKINIVPALKKLKVN
jgi:uncharacterized protein YpiB (UPF0302 family)